MHGMGLIPDVVYKFLPKSEYLWLSIPLERIKGGNIIIVCTSEKLHRLLLRNIDHTSAEAVSIQIVKMSIDEWCLHAVVGDGLISLLNEKRIEVV